MKANCPECKGSGEVECLECHHSHNCERCDGNGWLEVCLSEYIPQKGTRYEEDIWLLKSDHSRAISDYLRLCAINPHAKASYSQQLDDTIAELNRQAQELIK